MARKITANKNITAVFKIKTIDAPVGRLESDFLAAREEFRKLRGPGVHENLPILGQSAIPYLRDAVRNGDQTAVEQAIDQVYNAPNTVIGHTGFMGYCCAYAIALEQQEYGATEFPSKLLTAAHALMVKEDERWALPNSAKNEATRSFNHYLAKAQREIATTTNQHQPSRDGFGIVH